MPKKNRKCRKFTPRSQKYKKSIEECTNAVTISLFWTNLLAKLNEVYVESNPSAILCYGLGNFLESLQSRYQLGLLLAIKNVFKIKDCHIYDPKFTDTELQILAENGFEPISQNEEGKRSLLPGTFVFLPHCPKHLLNNLLWINWEKVILTKCVIFCNCIDDTITLTPNKIVNKIAYYINKISPHVVMEKTFCNEFMYDDVFNDMALHIFPNEKLKDLENFFWERDNEPSYDTEELEFTKNFNFLTLDIDN
ncbi:Sensitivity To Red Light Reduced-like, SRR1 [Cinara cedri]|uniref:Sensitivity To Red Light Reduced-like, SRR1 n=1 Tax=Cinara cedri TaxID=506608 RepID=A0A5E4NL95_9HEMI|nr:Sensitivity To Red Light Reduced-like, SRR1 [Cinara cedri]